MTASTDTDRGSIPSPHAPAGPPRNDVWRMFDGIAHRYDLANRVLSAGIDISWRNKMARLFPEGDDLRLLDMATGTGDVMLAMARKNPRVRDAVGMDMAGQMLAIGQDKISERALGDKMRMVRADATCIGAADDSFDVCTISFGIRNVTDVPGALREMRRVLRPGGRLLVLEFSLPHPLIRPFYLFYLRNLLPRIGGFLSGDPAAYKYLNTTIESFPYGQAFCALMEDAGLSNVKAHPLTFGIATLYQGDK